MNYEVKKSFDKDLDKINDYKLLKSVDKCIEQIKNAKLINDIKNCKKLVGYKNYYRIKIGNYRLGFFFDDKAIFLVRFLHRKEIYRYFP